MSASPGSEGEVGDRSIATEQFRLAVEASPTGTIMLDQAGRIVLVNARVEQLFGYARHELIGHMLEMLVPPRYRQTSCPMEAGRDLYGLCKDGREVPIGIGLHPLTTADRTCTLSAVVYITERGRATEHFRLAIDAAPNGMIMVDHNGRIVLVNAHVENLFGYGRGELIGQAVEMLVPQDSRADHPALRQDYAREPHARSMGAGRDLRGFRKNGEDFPVEIALNPLRTSEGDFVLCSIADITERLQSQFEREASIERRAKLDEISATLNDRETLLQEIHHRVKNNLQVVSSLISIQMRRTDDDASRQALGECAARVQAIALIHAMLYQSQDFLHISFSEYANRLAGNVFSAAGVATEGGRITLEIEIADVDLHVDKAVPCGLILNELITNALKHGFPNARRGTVRVELRVVEENRLCLAVMDNGVGLPELANLADVKSVGMLLVHSLAKQLRSKVEFSSGDWTTFKLEFPRSV